LAITHTSPGEIVRFKFGMLSRVWNAIQRY